MSTSKNIIAKDANGTTWLFVPKSKGVFVSYFKCVFNPEMGTDWIDDGEVSVRGAVTADKLVATKGSY